MAHMKVLVRRQASQDYSPPGALTRLEHYLVYGLGFTFGIGDRVRGAELQA